MSRQKRHISKSRQEKAAYVNYIKKLDYEPTKDEALDFSESSDNEPDYSIQKTNKVKRLTTWQQIQIHLEENWIKWVIAGIAIVISYFVFTSKVSISGINIRVDQNKEEIKNIRLDVKQLENVNHSQDLKIQKNEINIDNLKGNKGN